jgi:hypothetical protein
VEIGDGLEKQTKKQEEKEVGLGINEWLHRLAKE